MQCSDPVGTDRKILPGEFRGGRAGKTRYQYGVLAEPVNGATDLAGDVVRFTGSRRSEDAVLRRDGVVPFANCAKRLFNFRMVWHRHSLHRFPGNCRERTRSMAA